jgi:hypothetical protein
VTRRNIENAKKALATASKTLSKSDISERELRTLQTQLIKLRDKITDLDGKDLGRRSPAKAKGAD